MNAYYEKLRKIVASNKVLIYVILSVASLALAVWLIGINIGFWIILISWIVIFLIFFVRPTISALNIYMLAMSVVFVLSLLISFRVIGSGGSNLDNGEKSPEGISIEDCTSTTSDQPQTLGNWKSSIYSAPLQDLSSDGPKYANNVRSFSYSAIKGKTSPSDIYARIEKSDGSNITGSIITVEACDANNKATKYHTTKNSDTPAGENVVASIHYFHGANYLHGAGDYRIDVYVKPVGDSWHLIDRMTEIKITE